MKKISVIFLTVLLFFSLAHAQTYAELTLHYDIESVPAVDSHFSLYRVKDADGVWISGFDYHLDESAPTFPQTLLSYITRDGIPAAAQDDTNQKGDIIFSKLETGTYLIAGESKITDDALYTPIPMLIQIKDGKQYEITEKHDTIPNKPKPDDKNPLKVIVVWDDEGSNLRPDHVQVQLLNDGKLHDEVTLDKEMNWRYVWEDVGEEIQWSALEFGVPEDYSISIERKDTTFIITNRLRVSKPEITPDKPVVPDKPNKTDNSPDDPPDDIQPNPVNPDNPPVENPPDPIDPGKPTDLPQTGLDWFPVFITALIGIILLLTTIFLPSKGGPGEKEIKLVLLFIGIVLIFSSVLFAEQNLEEDRRAGIQSENAANAVVQETKINQELFKDPIPSQELDIHREMPVMRANGNGYIGMIRIDSLGINLPVMEEWSYEGMKIAPGRYSGSVYEDNFVICGHNYQTHFASLRSAEEGDLVVFTDIDGNEFQYQVSIVEKLAPDAVDEMINSDWPLTLFTCTPGRKARLAVRCSKLAFADGDEGQMGGITGGSLSSGALDS